MTKQLALWRGSFGNDYIVRNEARPETISRMALLWSRVLEKKPPISILEVGANVGVNLRALQVLFPDAKLTAIEPNELARRRLTRDGFEVHDATAQNLPFNDWRFDLAMTCGVLIHIDPIDRPRCMQEITRVASRYVLCAEYYAASPRTLEYRGHEGQLFLGDFGREYLDACPELAMLDYGFFWPEGITWWLFEKR